MRVYTFYAINGLGHSWTRSTRCDHNAIQNLSFFVRLCHLPPSKSNKYKGSITHYLSITLVEATFSL